MDLKDSRGRKYQIGDVAGKGGEATVYQVSGRGARLAKLYDRPNPAREHKLAWMIAHPPDDPAAAMGHTSIAWPVEMLYRDGRFAGYLMPHIRNTVPVLNAFHPRLRAQTFQGFTRQHLHNTAYNIAAALGAIHQRGYVVGDLNESNVLVARSTLVTLIDTDSFQVHTRTESGGLRTHLCEVGKPEYLPPEMQNRDLKKTVRIPEHDRFALAVLIFQLLMDGNHPFRARWKSSKEKLPLPERIARGMFPYRETLKNMLEPVADLQQLHPLLVDLFQRCFILGHESPPARPAPGEWERALAAAATELVSCRNGHAYSRHLSACPECARAPVPVRRPVAVRPKPAPIPSRPQASAPALTARLAQFRPSVSLPSIQLPRKLRRPFNRLTYYRLRSKYRKLRSGAFLRQPGVWAIGGLVLGALLGLKWDAVATGQLVGLVCGLVSGALAGEWVERRVGWGTFFSAVGALGGLLIWGLFGTSTSAGGWLLAGLTGGAFGLVFGYYGRYTELTLLWAAAGAAAGWFLGGFAAGLVPVNWLAAALSTGFIGLSTGVSYAIWKKR